MKTAKDLTRHQLEKIVDIVLIVLWGTGVRHDDEGNVILGWDANKERGPNTIDEIIEMMKFHGCVPKDK